MANEIKKELIQKKLDLVIQKLMHLGAPENEDTLKEGGEAIGFFSRDFGIKEWDAGHRPVRTAQNRQDAGFGGIPHLPA